MEHQALIARAVELGATKATIITQDQIVTSEEFRKMCESNRCGGYGKCWMCPPDVGEIEDLIRTVRGYTHGLWYQTIYELEDSFDFEGMTEGRRIHVTNSRKIGKELLPQLPKGALQLICGGCGYCERCAKQDGLPCVNPEEALSSVEAYGIDVSNTTKSTDLKYINGPDTVTYFGLILFSEESNG